MRYALPLALLLSASPALAGELPIRPDPAISPGEVMPGCTIVQACTSGYSKTVRHTSGKLKARVYEAYGITKEQRSPGSRFEIDHIVPLSLCGADTFANLFPQSYETQPWNARRKDDLEWRLRKLVCAGKVPLETAQREMATDWIAAFEKYFTSPEWVAMKTPQMVPADD